MDGAISEPYTDRAQMRRTTFSYQFCQVSQYNRFTMIMLTWLTEIANFGTK